MGENIFKLFYFTFLHNYQVLGFALAALAALFILIKHPSRRSVFFFLGFLLLIIHFEYDKHIVAGLAEQTANVLFDPNDTHYKAQWLTNVAFNHLIPVILWFTGWISVIFGILGLQFHSWPWPRRRPVKKTSPTN